MTVREYTCDLCGDRFVTGRTEDEEVAEAKETWGPTWDPSDARRLCDPCFQRAMELLGRTNQA